jgi:hypothetical protein
MDKIKGEYRVQYVLNHFISRWLVLSTNIKGRLSPVKKQTNIISFLKKKKVLKAILQENHFTDLEHRTLKKDCVGQMFSASYNREIYKFTRICLLKDILSKLYHNRPLLGVP